MFGNIILGGGVGAIIDHNNGSAYEYPALIKIFMGRMNQKIEEKTEVPKVKKPVFKSEPIKTEIKVEEKSAEEQKVAKSVAKTEDEPKPTKKVDFEITNPDDIKIDDKGQLGFF